MSKLGTEVKAFSATLNYEPTPLLEKAWEIIKGWNLKPLKSFEGVDLEEIRRIEKPLMSAGTEHYCTDKLEKIHLGWWYYMPKNPRITQTFVICPSDEYDLPLFISDLDERAHGSSLIVDLWPTVDPVAEEWYKEKYYDGLRALYKKYWDLGPQKIVHHPDLDWWRMIRSVFELNIEVPLQSREVLIPMFTDYLKYYSELYEKAEPVKEPKIREQIIKRKRFMRKWFRDRDPAKGVIIRALGPELERKVMIGLL